MPRLGLIGKSLEHSFSPAYFQNKFEALKLHNFSYQLFPLENIQALPELLQKFNDLLALHVTIPYKQEVLAFADYLSDDVQAIGAANLLLIERSEQIKISAYNTDVFGFTESLKPFLQHPVKKALILGNGGASKAVQQALSGQQIAFELATRNSIPDLKQIDLSAYDLIINSTPVGTKSTTQSIPTVLPLRYETLKPGTYFYDLVYNPAETDMMQEAARQGARVKNGLEMLHLQAERSWEIINRTFRIL